MHIITINSTEKPILYKTAQIVQTPLDPETVDQINQMRAFFKTIDGKAGFAAPQVGISKRIVLIEPALFDGQSGVEPVIFINPTWETLNQEMSVDFEGCLSVPQKKGIVERYLNIRFTGYLYDADQQTLTKVTRDYQNTFESVLWQHEIDHLDGQVYNDKAKIMLTDAEADGIQHHLAINQQLLPDTNIFDLGRLMLPIAQAFKKQLKPLHGYLLDL